MARRPRSEGGRPRAAGRRAGKGAARGRAETPRDGRTLAARLREAEDTLRAIRGGDVDAIVVYGPAGERIYTLRGAEHSYRVLVEAMQEGAATLSGEGTVLYCNRSFAQMLGASVEEVMGTPLAAHVPRALGPALAAILERARGGGAKGELALQPGAGEAVPVLLSVNPMTVESESLLCVVATDLSELGRLQDAIRGRDAFISVASHEFRTPLTSITLQLDALVRAAERGADAVSGPTLDRVGAVRRQLRRLSQLVEELLDVSRIQSGHLELSLQPVDAAAVAREVVERHRAQAGDAGCTLALEAPGPVLVVGDRSRLDQVVTNLVGNAIKYGKGRPVEVSVSEAAGLAVLAVADQGIGVAPEYHERIFQRFERAASPPEFGGLGLGLWIVREILSRMGGRIRVESRAGEGARFVVELPATRAGAAEGAA